VTCPGAWKCLAVWSGLAVGPNGLTDGGADEVKMDPGIAIPILPARDLRETRAFYERLGFAAAGW